MQQYLTRIITSSILIVFTVLVGLFFQAETKQLDQVWSKTQQIYSEQTNQISTNVDISPSIWLNTNTTELELADNYKQIDTAMQFHLIGSTQTLSHQTVCSSENLTPSIQIPLDVSAPSLSVEYLSDLLSLAIDKQYFVYLRTPSVEIDEYALISHTDEYSSSSIQSAIDCGEQTQVAPTTLLTHVSTFSSEDNIHLQ